MNAQNKSIEYYKEMCILLTSENLKLRQDLEVLNEKHKTPLNDYFDEWLSIKKTKAKPDTYSGYAIHVEKHFKPYFKDYFLETITSNDIEKYFALKLCDGLSRQTVKSHRSTLRAIFSFAYKHDMISENVVMKTDAIKTEKFDYHTLPFNEIWRLLEITKNLNDYPPILLSSLLGIENNSNSYSMADEVKADERKPFELPERNGNNQRVIAYLVKTRQLDRHIVNDCIKQGIIYEDKRHNVVAVGCDENGEAKSADLRSSSTYGAKFRGCVTGSEKRYGFHLDSNCNSDTVFVFEAFIDSLSFLSLRNMSAKARNNPDYYKKFNVLVLGGTTDNALSQYVISRPQISNVVIMLDNDDAGREGAMKIKSKFEKFDLNCTIRTMAGSLFRL